MNCRMDCEGGGIDRAAALNDFPFVADKHQISRCDVGKMNAERVDPAPVRVFGVSDGNVPREALVIRGFTAGATCGTERVSERVSFFSPTISCSILARGRHLRSRLMPAPIHAQGDVAMRRSEGGDR